MGLLGSLVGNNKQSVKTPDTGFFAMPAGYKNLYINSLGQANNTLLPGGQLNSSMFTPVPQNDFETNAYGMIGQGVAPNAQGLQSDINMLTNPYDESVINGINREAQGDNSLVNQNATMAGQQNSNRQFLGSSDVEQNRLNNIGMFKQSQYNNAINQALGPLAGLRQQDISNNLVAGSQQRDIAQQGQEAPYTALQAILGTLGGYNSAFAGGSPSQTVKTGSGFNLGTTLSNAGSLASFFSDVRLKEEIEYLGVENGHNVYSFRYRQGKNRYIGVMAHEVKKVKPEAVKEVDGYMMVDYDMIGVKMRSI